MECLNGGIDDRSGFISIILNINSLFPEGVFQKIILSIESYPSVINEKVASSHRRAQTSLTSLTQLVPRSQKGPCMHLSLGIRDYRVFIYSPINLESFVRAILTFLLTFHSSLEMI